MPKGIKPGYKETLELKKELERRKMPVIFFFRDYIKPTGIDYADFLAQLNTFEVLRGDVFAVVKLFLGEGIQ